MPSTPVLMERKLKRSTLKQDTPAEGYRTLPAAHHQEENTAYEITSIGDINAKRSVLPNSQLTSKGVMSKFRSEDAGAQSAKVKFPSKDRSQANDPVIFGLSDLGTNFSTPTRPASTSRMLPHIARRHLQKDTLSFSARTKPLPDHKVANREESEQIKIKALDRNKGNDLHARHPYKQEDGSYCRENSSAPQCVSLNIRRCDDSSECVLSPNNLQSLSLLSYKSESVEQKLLPKTPQAPQTPKSKTSVSSGDTFVSYRSKKSGQLSSRSIKSPTTSTSSDIPSPSQSFMPIISVRNLHIDSKRQIECQQNSVNQGMTRSLNSRPLQSRERNARLRKTHPIIPPASVKTDLSTIMKGRHIK